MAAKKRKGKAKATGARSSDKRAPVVGDALTDHPTGTLVPQPHGGALRNGGTNKGGPGRPPEALRMKSRSVYEKWLTWADGIMDQAIAAQAPAARPVEGEKKSAPVPKAPDEDAVLSIGKTAGRFGLGHDDMVSRQAIREVLQKQVEILTNILPASEAERVLSALSPLWSTA